MSEEESWALNMPYALPAGDDGSEKKCAVFRNFAAVEAGHLIDREDETVHSLYQYFERNWEKFKHEDCLGTKTQIPVSGEYEYKWRTYDEIHTDTQILANAILAENLAGEVHDEDFKLTLKVVGIVSINREEWVVTDLAANLLDVTSVPLYETLGEELLNLILTQTEMETLFGSDVCLVNVVSTIKETTKLKRVVTFDRTISEALQEAAKKNNVEVISYHELLAKYTSPTSHTLKEGYSIIDC